ncbi:MAG: DUF4142 domain-containing protein [Nitrosospira sp.]|nr:DUF4142 domain-containing protein [Nitrosospira sp.]
MKSLLILAIALIAPVFIAHADPKGLDDAEIVAIAMTLSQAEINAGNLAQSVSSHPEIKKFGQRVAAEHDDFHSSLRDWVNKQNIAPQRNSISDSLKASEEKYLEKLKGLSGILFNLDYMSHKVVSHQQALDMWDKKLIPEAEDEELKSLLRAMRKRLADNLEDARLIKSSLGRKK